MAVEIYPNQLSLGEAVLLLGSPISARLCWLSIGLNPYIEARIYFSNDVFAYAYQPAPYSQEQRFRPDMVIENIGFFNNPLPSYLVHERPWKGFAFQAMSEWEGCGNPPEHTWY